MKGVPLFLVALLAAGVSGCGKRVTRIDVGNREQVLHMGNGDEIEDLDPQVVTGIIEHNVIAALFEGLVCEDPVDLHPIPGTAESWTVSDDKRIYTFKIRRTARWSNGERVTARDFYESYKRMLLPALGSEYVNMLFVVENAADYYEGKIKDFSKVGFKLLDDSTLEVKLKAPTPYFLWMLGHHYSWWPVHIPTILKHGRIDDKNNQWTRPENFVGNGPFTLAEWKVNTVLKVKRNHFYWDDQKVTLKEIWFYPIQSRDTEERAFRSGQLHVTYEIPRHKVPFYEKARSPYLRIDPYLGTYFYRLNVTHPALKDKRVRRALAMAVDREAIVRNVTRSGELPANTFVPTTMANYKPVTNIPTDFAAAKKLLADAGFPEGRGLPPIEIHFNTEEKHRMIAEAIQQMWHKNLGIRVTLVNQEWKVYLDAQDTLAYMASRGGWIGDYIDPNTFLEMWKTGDGNNDTGWGNPDYDRLIEEARVTIDPAERLQKLERAEAILLDEAPVIPIYFYTKPYLVQTSVRNWFTNVLDHHPYKHVFLQAPGI